MSETYILQSDDVYDSEIISGSPNTPRGLNTVLSLGNLSSDADYQTGRSLIYFAKLSTGGVPKNRTVLSATLSLYLTTDRCSYSRTYSFFRLKTDFTESQVTWNVRKTGVNWHHPGLYTTYASDDYEKTAIATTTLGASEAVGFKNWNLDPGKIFEVINGVYPNYGLFGMCDAEYNDQYFFRSNNHETASTRPKLTVVVEDFISEGVWM